MKLRTEFSHRAELIEYLQVTFPESAAISNAIPPQVGGRRAGEALLAQVDPVRYNKNRNYLKGAVSRLAPFLRHGVLTLDEVRRYVLQKAGKGAEKFVNELGWRDYWQRVYQQIGTGIWKDREAYKTGYRPADYQAELPADVTNAKTDLACMDAFILELYETGYLHNHARMWVASYLIHWRRVRWQTGAAWFLLHLLDGDPASNNLSWQWIASTFSTKPYFFNRDNLEQFTDGVYCRSCSFRTHGCPLEGTYPELAQKLFPHHSTTF